MLRLGMSNSWVESGHVTTAVFSWRRPQSYFVWYAITHNPSLHLAAPHHMGGLLVIVYSLIKRTVFVWPTSQFGDTFGSHPTFQTKFIRCCGYGLRVLWVDSGSFSTLFKRQSSVYDSWRLSPAPTVVPGAILLTISALFLLVFILLLYSDRPSVSHRTAGPSMLLRTI